MTNEELRTLLEEAVDGEGRTTRESVVALASDPKHPLHADPNFLWGDDREAAHQYRLEYAGRLIRKVYFVRRPAERRQARVPYYVRAPRTAEAEPGHVPVQTVEPASADARIVAADELRRVIGILRRAAGVVAVLELPGAADDLARLLASARELAARLEVPQVMAVPA